MVSPPRPTAAEMIDGKAEAVFLENVLSRHECSLGIQRIKDSLDHQDIHAAIHEGRIWRL